MALSDVTKVSVRAAFPMFGGRTARGSVTFEPPDDLRQLVVVDSSEIVQPSVVRRRLDSTGAVAFDVLPSNHPSLSPAGWTYKVTENIFGARNPNVYYVEVPYNAAGGIMTLAKAQRVRPVSAGEADEAPVTSFVAPPPPTSPRTMLWSDGSPILWSDGAPILWQAA